MINNRKLHKIRSKLWDVASKSKHIRIVKVELLRSDTIEDLITSDGDDIDIDNNNTTTFLNFTRNFIKNDEVYRYRIMVTAYDSQNIDEYCVHIGLKRRKINEKPTQSWVYIFIPGDVSMNDLSFTRRCIQSLLTGKIEWLIEKIDRIESFIKGDKQSFDQHNDFNLKEFKASPSLAASGVLTFSQN